MTRFKKNDLNWRKRLEYNKEQLKREHLRAEEYLKTIQEMTKRVENVEKKNKDLYRMI